MQGLDFVIAEAKKRGIYLILSLVNNMDGFGGKKQYVQWARDRGHYLGSDDDFFSDALTQQFYKNHIKVPPCSYLTSYERVAALYSFSFCEICTIYTSYHCGYMCLWNRG